MTVKTFAKGLITVCFYAVIIMSVIVCCGTANKDKPQDEVIIKKDKFLRI